MTRFALISILFFLVYCADAIPQSDHLIPDPAFASHPDDGEILLVRRFWRIYLPNVVAKVIVIPAFNSESAIGIRRRSDSEGRATYTLMVIRLSSSLYKLYSEEIDKILSTYPDIEKRMSYVETHRWEIFDQIRVRSEKEISTDICEKSLDSDLAIKLIEIWRAALDQAAPREDNVRDGVSYYFSMEIDPRGTLSAVTNYDPDDSAMNALSRLINSLRRYCSNSEAGLYEAVDLAARRLRAQE